MKLEAIDPLNLGNICVATICKVSLVPSRLQQRFLRAGWWQSAPYWLLPAGNLLSRWGSEACQPCGLAQACQPWHQAGRLAESLASHPWVLRNTWPEPGPGVSVGLPATACCLLWGLALPRLSRAGVAADLCYCCSLRSQPHPSALLGTR